ncbi:MAG: hypothetical protein ACE5I3_01615 [Phycisphaerae bacterium]
MSFRPFQSEFADHRVVLIPADLDDEQRARFVTKTAAAVKQQANLAASSHNILRVGGEIEQQGDRILIPHEPAAPGNPAALEAPSELLDIGTIWWLSWSLVQALKAVPPGTPHGGIQIATLYLDEAGRVKLGDFGIAPVFEVTCGIDARRQIHCDGMVRTADGGGTCSGVWSLLSEDDSRDHGWIAPYFGHELLEGTLRLNPKADQFAAGTLLYLLATGTHPYGAQLADPTLMLYFHLEPFAVRDERSEWAEVFERDQAGFSTTADKPILGWSSYIQRLLHSDPGERFANPAEAQAATAEFCPAAWAEASAAISAGLKLLDVGEVDAFLQKTARWKDDQALPGLWREQLSNRLAVIESRKEEIAAHKRLEQRLMEGQEALNNVEVERARAIARQVLAAPQCDDALRAEAEELIQFCDEQEQFIQSGADDLAKAYLESARECLARNEFEEARQLLNGLLNDPAIPNARVAQARKLIAEVELTEQRIEQQLGELAGAGDDLRAGHYEAARQRLQTLLEEKGLPQATAAQARALLEQVAQAQARRAACVAALDEARIAWERADLEALEAYLAQVPEDFADPEIADVRGDLAARREPLRAALERRMIAKEAFASGDAGAALAEAEQARDIAELPQILRDQLDELLGRCRATIEQREKERIELALEMLREAEAACDALRLDECRRRLEDDAIKQPGLPEEIVAKAGGLLRTCERIKRAQNVLEYARQHLADGEFREASALLEGLKSEGLPSAIVAELEGLRADVSRARQEHARRERQKLAARLDEIDAIIDAGELGRAQAALKPIEAAEYLNDELRRRIAAVRAVIEKQRPVLATIRAAEAALAGEPSDLAEPRAALERLPADLPAWAASRIAAVRQRAAELAERRRREAIRRAAAGLDAAQAALDAGDLPTGRSYLDQARAALELDAGLAERHKQLTAHAAQLEEWLPKVKATSDRVGRGDLLAAHRELTDLLQNESIPELCRARLAELKGRTEKLIAARQQEIDAELAALAAVLVRRGRRARRFHERVGALKSDSLATAQHNAQADELLAEYERLPEPKTPKAPLAIAGSVGVVAVVAAGLYFGGVFGGGGGGDGGDGGESGAGSARDQIVAALARLQSELAEAAEQARAQHRVHNDWELVFEPTDEFPTTLFAIEPMDGAREEVGVARRAAELELLRLTPELYDILFPISVASRIAAAVERLQMEVNAARRQADHPAAPAPQYVVRLEPADSLPATVIARSAQRAKEIRLGEVADAELDELALTDEWRERLFGPPAPPVAVRIAAAVARLQAEVDSARGGASRPDVPAPRFVLRLAPTDSLPATVIARNEQTAEEIRLGEVADAELDELALTDEWRARLFPPPPEPDKPTIVEVTEAYLEELRKALPRAVVYGDLLPASDGTFEVAAAWKERALRSFAGLRFDEEGARFTTPVASVAAHFRLQIEALAAIERVLRIAIPLDDPEAAAYEAALRLSDPGRDVIVEHVDLQTGSVRVKTAARLDADPRSRAAFPFSAVYSSGKFAIDDAARAAFRVYLSDLQQHQLQDSLRGIEQELALPPGVRLSWPGDFEGGPRIALRVLGTDERTFAALEADWNPQALLYEIDVDEALAALRDGVQAAAGDEVTRAALAAAWPEIRPTLTPPADQPGTEYFGRCDLLALALREDQPEEPFAVAVEVTIGPQEAASQERIQFPARLSVQDGALGWDSAGTREAKATIVARLQALAGDESFRLRRQQEALAQLAAELHPDAVSAEAEGGELRADATVAGRQRIFTWTWDNAALRYANRVEPTPPAATLADRLQQLASQPAADLRAFRDALTEVMEAKIERYGAPSYTSAEDFGAAANPAGALVAASATLQRLIAPTPTRDPFPVVFIEYLVGETDVYGLSWRTVTDDNDAIIGIADAKVWQVMPAAELRSYPEPAAFRRDYSTDAALGERLLGHALGETLAGSANASGGSFGVVVAPDGPLWLTRWEQVRFDVRPVVNVDLRGAADPGRIATLRDLLKPTPLGRERLAWRRTGLWCVPTLAGQWRGPPDQVGRLQLGVLVSGKKPSVASFRRRGRLLFAPVTDPTLTGDFGWAQFARSVRPEEIGYLFWDRRWSDEGWNPTPFTSFSLIQIP